MTALIVLSVLGMYRPECWQVYPSLSDVRCISVGTTGIYVATPAAICIIDRFDCRYERALTCADGLVGEIRLCAYNPSRSELIVITDGHSYSYTVTSGQPAELSPPAGNVKSVGVALDGVYFDTDKGLLHKSLTSDQYAGVTQLPHDITWYGARDTLNPHQFVVLTPYFFIDEHLVRHDMGLVRPDVQHRRLLVSAPGYGVAVYDSRSGFQQTHVALGPGYQHVRRIVRLDNQLWFLGDAGATTLDSAGTWSYFPFQSGVGYAHPSFRLLQDRVLTLGTAEGLTAVLKDSSRLLIGTSQGLYTLARDNEVVQLVTTERPVNGAARVGDSLIVGTDEGLFLVRGESLEPISDPFGRADWGVFDIARSSAGWTYLVTQGGVVGRSPAGAWTHVVPPGLDLSRPVRAVAAADPYLFIADGTGLVAWNSTTDSYLPVGALAGLPVSGITALYADSAALWIAGSGVVARFDYRRALR